MHQPGWNSRNRWRSICRILRSVVVASRVLPKNRYRTLTRRAIGPITAAHGRRGAKPVAKVRRYSRSLISRNVMAGWTTLAPLESCDR